MTRAIVGQWGKSLGVRLPAGIARSVGLEAGKSVEVAARDGEIVLTPAENKRTIEDLFAGKTAEEWRELYRDSTVDWGPDVGREIIEE